MPIALSFAKMIKDVNDASGDAELKPLLKESIELTHAKLTTQLRTDQARQAVDRRPGARRPGRRRPGRAQDQLAHLTADEQFVEGVATTLLRGAQGHMDIVMKYAFFAARALEIYTLTDLSADIRYDYGYVHPDQEADQRDGLLPLLKLIAAYRSSWARFVGIIALRNATTPYFGSGTVVRDKVFLTVDARHRPDPARAVPADTPSDPAGRSRRPAADQVRGEGRLRAAVAAGATANVPALSCIVEHSGRSSSRRRDNSVAELVLRPRATVVQTAKTGLVVHRRARRHRPRRAELLGPRRRHRLACLHRAGRDDPPRRRPRPGSPRSNSRSATTRSCSRGSARFAVSVAAASRERASPR